MKREIQTKFFTFDQNNSGGYFVNDDANGVCESVIIEAQTPDEAWQKLLEIGDKVDGFMSYCGCCGERWSDYMDESDGKEVPSIYGTPVEECTKDSAYRTRAFVHYYDGTMKEFKFKDKE